MSIRTFTFPTQKPAEMRMATLKMMLIGDISRLVTACLSAFGIFYIKLKECSRREVGSLSVMITKFDIMKSVQALWFVTFWDICRSSQVRVVYRVESSSTFLT